MVPVLALSIGGSLAQAGGGIGRVDLVLEPVANDLTPGQTFDVRVIARSSDGSGVPFSTISAVLTWNPSVVRLTGFTNNGPFGWLFSGFLPDANNLNDGLLQSGVPNNDGNALYQALPSGGTNPVATAGGLLAATIHFEAVQGGCATTLAIVPALSGTISRVLGDQVGETVTGTLGSAQLRVTGVEGDDDGDGVGDCADACPDTPALESINAVGCSCDQVPPCDDVLFCNGVETCANGDCQPGVDPCPGLPCDEASDQCLCVTNDDCDDDDPCTDVECAVNGDCVISNNAAPCDDGDACTINDTCAGGTCTGTAVDCTGLDSACSLGQCAPGSGICQRVAINEGAGCNDLNDCTTSDACTAGLCTGTDVDCSAFDGTCLAGVCNPDTGACVSVAADEGGACDDGLDCTDNDACNAGLCIGIPSVDCPCADAGDCDDGNPCTDDSCVDNLCAYVNNSDPCDDGLPCTENDMCNAGMCGGTPVDCSGSADDCNIGVCVAATGACVAQPSNQGGACDDGLFCTVNATCSAGVCAGGSARSCDDGVACTVDTCNEGTNSCNNLPSNAACSDGLFCNGTETCHVTLGCQPGSPMDCDDGVACTVDTCNESTDSCVNGPFDAACDDGLFCNGVETCHATLGCQAGTPVNCNDAVACTVDSCIESTDSCANLPNDNACNDNLFCNGVETCHATLGCQAGTPVNCNDGVACTVDSCIESTDSCANLPNDSACNDNLFCNGVESCHVTLGCQAGTPVTCDDGLFCNGTETCHNTLGCQAGTPVNCDDGIACTDDSCDEAADACRRVPNNANCDDGNDCTDNRCLSGIGCVFTPDNGNACSDGNACTNDACQNGICVGTAVQCPDDGVFCTRSACDPSGADGNCTLTVPDNAGLACNDGLFCTVGEVCASGQCGNAPGGPCAEGEACDEAANACFTCQVDADCDNDQFCDGVETCSLVDGCLPGTPPDCGALADDGVACTDELCDPLAGGGDGACVSLPNDANCSDGLFCNGAETCDAVLGCQPGNAPCTVPTTNCNETTDQCAGDAPPPPPPPPASAPPPPPSSTSDPVLFVQTDIEGLADANLTSAPGDVTTTVIVTDGTPASRFRLTLRSNSGAPGLAGDETFDGFADGLALPVTLEVAEITSVVGDDTTIVITLTVTRDLLDALGLEPEEADIHVFDEIAAAWVRAGEDFLGESDPTDQVGDYGYRVNDDDSVSYWVVRDRLSVFAVGQSIDGPSEPPAGASEIDVPDDPTDPGDEEPGADPDPGDGSEDESGDEPELPPAQDDSQNGNQNDNRNDNGLDDGDSVIQPPSTSCGAGGAACGAIGLVNLLAMGLGLVTLRRRR